MCIAFWWTPDGVKNEESFLGKYALVMASNRDESFARPTSAPQHWSDAEIFAPRDALAGGTWLGLAPEKWALLTNNWDTGIHQAKIKSRGGLVSNFLKGRAPNAEQRTLFEGFNLIASDKGQIKFYTNRFPDSWGDPVCPGFHVLTNNAFGTLWPKASRGFELFRSICARHETDDDVRFAQELFEKLLSDDSKSENSLSSTYSADEKKAAAYICVPPLKSTSGDLFGTRTQIVILVRSDTNRALVLHRDRLLLPSSPQKNDTTANQGGEKDHDSFGVASWSEVSCTELPVHYFPHRSS